MTFQKNTILVAVVVTLCALAFIYVRGCDSQERASRPIALTTKTREPTRTTSHIDVTREGLQGFLDSYKHPIALYGKVVDQFGEPVPGATVEIFVAAKPYEEGTEGGDAVLTTDEEGRFSIVGLTGSSIGASAMKEGYLRIPPLNSFSSSARLSYTGGDGTGDRHTTPSNPIILKLLKIGTIDPMIHIDKKRWKLPLDGTPKMIAIDSEEGKGEHQIEFRLRSSTHIRELPGNDAYTPFDWSLEIRVPGGGFVWDESDARFEAPASGYKEKVLFKYSATMPRKEWKRVQHGRYFVKFADGFYGRIQFEINGGSDRKPLYMESWLSLKAGSRNLATENMIINVMESEEPTD